MPDAETRIERYCAAVSDGLRGLAPDRRAESLADLRVHLRARGAEGAPVDVGRLLAELGDPAEIAAEAGAALAAPSRDGWAVAAIMLTVLAWPVGLWWSPPSAASGASARCSGRGWRRFWVEPPASSARRRR